jgi:hypothetical protein
MPVSMIDAALSATGASAPRLSPAASYRVLLKTIMSGTRLRIDYGLHTDRIQLAQMTQFARI